MLPMLWTARRLRDPMPWYRELWSWFLLFMNMTSLRPSLLALNVKQRDVKSQTPGFHNRLSVLAFIFYKVCCRPCVNFRRNGFIIWYFGKVQYSITIKLICGKHQDCRYIWFETGCGTSHKSKLSFNDMTWMQRCWRCLGAEQTPFSISRTPR